MSWEHAAEARAALNAIVSDPEHGVSALSSAQTMSNLLKDLLPDAPREKSILVAAAEAGLADTLRDHVAQGMDPSTAIRLTASSFSSTTPFTPEACSWVTGEIAGALGISQPGGGAAGGGAAGGFGGTPGGYDPTGQGAPTQMAPIPGYTPGQQGTQGMGGYGQGTGGLGQAGGYGQGTGGQAGQGAFGQGTGYDPNATAPGAWPAGTAGLGGTGQQQGQGGWQQGQAAATGQQGQGGWSPAQGGYGPAGTGQPVQPGQGGWQPAGVGFGGGGFGGTPGQGRSRRGWYIGGGVLVVVIVIIVIVASLGGHKTPSANTHSTPPRSVTPSVTPSSTTPTPNATGEQNLATIMSAPGEPIGKTCTSTPPEFGLNASTVLDRRFCETYTSGVIIWGYQFDNASDFKAGFTHIQKYTGFDNTTPGKGCPPPSGVSEGKTLWYIKDSPRYNDSANNQELDCFLNGKTPQPTLMWSMPTQNAFFIAKDQNSGATINSIIKWWESIHYAQ